MMVVQMIVKRIENTSVTQTCFTNIDWYSNTIKLCYEYLAKESIKRYGKIIDYIQLIILYEFQWRFFTDKEKINIDKKEIKKYWNILVKLLKQCDDKNILSLPIANDFKKKFKYSLKYSTTVMDSINEKGYYEKNGVKIYFKNDQITIK